MKTETKNTIIYQEGEFILKQETVTEHKSYTTFTPVFQTYKDCYRFAQGYCRRTGGGVYCSGYYQITVSGKNYYVPTYNKTT